MTVSLSEPLLFTIPLVISVLAAIVWLQWGRPVNPPRLRGYAVRQGWQIDPIALLDRELLEGRMAEGILSVHNLLSSELAERHQITAWDVQRQFYFFGKKPSPAVREACSQVRALATTYLIAARAEDPRRTDLWSRWRRPSWRAEAERRFDEELTAVESLWPRLEETS
ncbi:MAG: hypothetical protein WB788_08965 [Thermoplasmata archaeon]